jgi:DNA-binding response OmpR family regulator
MKSKTSGNTILVVDDDIDYLHQQQVRLEAAGYQVMIAEGQKQAEDLLEQRLPDLAVIDLMMENQDGGFTLCYHIKKKRASIPVIVVSGVESETGLEFDAATSEERSWIKADRFLAKPVRFEQLLGEIERLLRG